MIDYPRGPSKCIDPACVHEVLISLSAAFVTTHFADSQSGNGFQAARRFPIYGPRDETGPERADASNLVHRCFFFLSFLQWLSFYLHKKKSSYGFLFVFMFMLYLFWKLFRSVNPWSYLLTSKFKHVEWGTFGTNLPVYPVFIFSSGNCKLLHVKTWQKKTFSAGYITWKWNH